MKKQFILAFSVVLVLALGACSKKMGELPSEFFKTNPSPLEVKGGKVKASVDGKFPEKYFHKKAIVTVTPVLKFDGKEVRGQGKDFQGEKIVGNNGQVIVKKTGGNFSIPVSFDYVPEMAKSELFLDFQLNLKGKVITTIPQVKVADGVIAVSQLLSANSDELAPALAADKFQRIIKEAQEADIKFLIQQANLRTSETNSASVKDLISAVGKVSKEDNKEISSLNILGYASPDGPLSLNEDLAEKRTKVTANFLKNQLRRVKTDAPINVDFTAEDWDGFKKLVEESNIADKALILNVLSSYSDPETREREIKNMSAAYTTLAEDILPQLRRSRLQLVVDVIGKSDEEIAALAKKKPADLSVEELLYAATLTSDVKEKAAIYQKVIDVYPNDFRGYNNLALVKLLDSDIIEAEKLLEKAAQIAPNSPDVNYNLGLVALHKGELDKAQKAFEKSTGANANQKAAIGILAAMRGDYEKAKTSLEDVASNNAAVLHILHKNYNAAKNTLAKVKEPDAKTAYLSAVVAARTNDVDGVYKNLKEAISKDKSYLEKAKKDIEFVKFIADPKFLDILK